MWRLWQQVEPFRFMAVLAIFLSAVALLIHFLLFQSDRFNWLDGPRVIKPAAVMAPAAAPATPPASAPATEPVAAAPSPAVPAPAPAPTGGWKVQLGAYGDPTNATARWEEVKARFAGREPSYEKRGNLTRLVVHGFASQQEASAACGDLTNCDVSGP